MTSLRTFLEECRALERVCSLGPWEKRGNHHVYDNKGMGSVADCGGASFYPTEKNANNAAFIAASRTAVPLLLEMLEKAVTALEWTVKPGHDEPDDYTRLACAQHRASEALSELERLSKGEKP